MTDSAVSNDKAYLLVRNPSSVFVCWTWSRGKTGVFEALGYEPEVIVKLSAAEDKVPAVEQAVPWNACKLYMKPPVEGRTYTAAVYAVRKDGVREKLMESNAALSPVSSPSPGISAGYASAEFFRRGPA